MAAMIARFGMRDRNGGKLRTMGLRGIRDEFVSKAAAYRVGAVIALALLWCGSALAAEPRVLLLRGWFGVFSTGLDGLADELKKKGINAEVEGHLYWSTAVSAILRERASGTIRPLVLVGHSQGANNVIDMARSLDEHKIPVDLLVTLAPFLQYPVPANVLRAVNFYQSGGWGAPLSGDSGFHGKILNVDMADDPTILHISIDKSERVQAQILREIAGLPQPKQ